MTRSNSLAGARLLAAIAAAALLGATAVPAFAVSIRHTNRAGGDPEAASVPVSRGTPPVDSTGARYFDKAHEDGNVR